jgi:hypothetical protein
MPMPFVPEPEQFFKGDRFRLLPEPGDPPHSSDGSLALPANARHEPSHRATMPRDRERLAACDPVQQLRQMRLCLKRADFVHLSPDVVP